MRLVDTQESSKPRKSLDESMIPAINIVFLLLIFFMIAGHIEARDNLLQVPSSSSEENLITHDVEIKVSAEADYFLAGEKVELPLSDDLAALSLSPESTITIYADRNLPASALDPVLKSVRQVGVKQLLIATVQQ